MTKRAPGISKGMWKKELKRQITGSVDKRRRTGSRQQAQEDKMKASEDKKPSMLTKRKSATMHKTNTSTFKKKRQRKE